MDKPTPPPQYVRAEADRREHRGTYASWTEIEALKEALLESIKDKPNPSIDIWMDSYGGKFVIASMYDHERPAYQEEMKLYHRSMHAYREFLQAQLKETNQIVGNLLTQDPPL